MDRTNPTVERDSRQQASILVVEDEVVVSLDIQQRLKRLGYSIAESAISGREAIEMAAKLQPDLVLMDIRLKGEMDGFEAARLIDAQMGIPIIFLTAYGDEQTMERVKEANPLGYLLKPIEDLDLRRAVAVALYRHRTERALSTVQEELIRANADLKVQFERATVMADLGIAGLKGAGFEELAEMVLPLLTHMLSMDTALLLERTDDGFVVAAVTGSKANISKGMRISPNATLIGGALENQDPVRIPIPDGQRPMHFPSAESVTVRDGFTVRVDGYPVPWGILMVFSQQRRILDGNDGRFLRSIANVLSMVLRGHQIEDAMLELSTPVLRLKSSLLLVPLIGPLGPRRMRHLRQILLQHVRSEKARVVVIDVTGLVQMDVHAASDLMQMVETVTMLGARVLMSGVSATLANSLVELGIPLQRLHAIGDLESAIEEGTRLLTHQIHVPLSTVRM